MKTLWPYGWSLNMLKSWFIPIAPIFYDSIKSIIHIQEQNHAVIVAGPQDLPYSFAVAELGRYLDLCFLLASLDKWGFPQKGDPNSWMI